MKPAAAIAGAGLLGAAMTGAVAVEKSPRLMIQAEKYVVREFNVVYRRASKVLGLSETRVTQGLAERPTGEIARAARIEAQAVTQQSHSYGAGREALYLYEQAQPRIAERLAATPPKSVEEVNKVLEKSMIDEGKRRGIDFTLFSGKLKSDKVYEIGDHTLRLGDVPVWSILFVWRQGGGARGGCAGRLPGSRSREVHRQLHGGLLQGHDGGVGARGRRYLAAAKIGGSVGSFD